MKTTKNKSITPPCGLNDAYMQEIETAFARLAKAPGNTGVVYSRFFDTLDRVNLTGKDAVESCSKKLFLQTLFELRRSRTRNVTLPDPADLRRAAEQCEAEGVVPLGLAQIVYDHFSKRVTRQVAKQMLQKPTSLGLDRLEPKDVLQTRKCFMAAALVDRPQRGRKVTFRLGQRFRVDQRDGLIEKVEIDFDDGKGFRTVPVEGDVAVSYKTDGTKSIAVRACCNKTVLNAKTELQIEAKVSRQPGTKRTVSTPAAIPITAAESYSGNKASGQYYIWYAGSHTSVVKPALFCEAFRPGGAAQPDDLYARLSQSGLADALTSNGFDIVILCPNDELAYIQDNGFLYKTLLETLNALASRSGLGVACGIGLGALIVRFAIARMRRAGENPQVSHYVSIDGPHQGLNIPPGVQLLISGFQVWSEEAAAIYNQLRSPALKQSLAYSCLAEINTWPQTDLPVTAAETPERIQFRSDLGNLDDLTGIIKLAIGNGATNGTGQGFDPGAALLQCTMNNKAGGGVAWFNGSALPHGDADLASMVVHCCKAMGKITGRANATSALDSCPGATNAYYLNTLAEDLRHGPFNIGGESVYPQVTQSVTNTCLVPSVSAAAYNDGGNPATPIIDSTRSGFDEFLLPESNQAYGALSTWAMDWLRHRIVNQDEDCQVAWRDRTQGNSRIDGLVIPPDAGFRSTSTWVEVTCYSAGTISLSLGINGHTLCSIEQTMAANTTWTSPHYCVPVDHAILLVTGLISKGSPVEMEVRLKAKRYATGQTIARQVFVAYANPTSMFSFLDHTYIDCPDHGRTFQCFGGLGSHNKPVARGNGYLDLAEKYRNNDSRFADNAFLGFYFWDGAVCHQAANCFLLSAGQMLASSVQGYWLSVAFFGFYGRNSTGWFNEVFLPKYEEFLREHGITDITDSLLLQTVLTRRYARWKTGEVPSTKAIVVEDTRMLMQQMPNVRDIDPDAVTAIASPILDAVDQIYRDYEASVTLQSARRKDISPDQAREMAGKLNQKSIEFQDRLETELRADKFTRLTGLPAGQRTGIIDISLIR